MEEFPHAMLRQSSLLSWLACPLEESRTSPRNFKDISLGSNTILAFLTLETEDV
jgi:hypothetical protein